MQRISNPSYMSEIHALISLIEDPDENIYNQVRTELKELGEKVLPQLEQYWELEKFGPLFQTRVEELINTIQYDSIYTRLKDWKASADQDLLQGALIINRYQYPGFDDAEVTDLIMRMRQDVWLELNDNLTAFETIKVMNHIIFNIHRFEGNRDQYNDPRNSYISDICAGRKGNPLALGIIYTHIARSLGLPIYGVNLPSHFIVCYLDHDHHSEQLGLNPLDADVLFYINPFQGGSILHEEEIDDFLKKQNITGQSNFYRPCTPVEMISRMLNNLIHAYIALEKDEKVRELKALLSALTE
ncbi:MAG: transglutaminase-like domain-containing protein [Flavobacteriales bacterium]